MSTQPLEQAMSISRGILAAVSPDQLATATPCASWDVSALINHMVGGQYFFATNMTGTPASGEAPDFAAGDYVAAFDEGSAQCLAAFSADGAMDQIVTLPFGQFPGSAFIGLAITDTLQHAWDLAKATGQDTNLAPDLSAGVLAQARQAIPDTFRGPDGKAPFGPATEAPADASPSDQLAAFLGRTV
jgi:uncharacterized protein (TIGR03086 family)